MELNEVKKNLNDPVNYNGKRYTLRACIIRKNNSGYYYEAEILDKCGNSIIVCGLDEIERTLNDE